MSTLAGFPALELDISNPKPLVAPGITLTVDVYPEDGEESVLSFTSELSMAPNSSMPFTRVLTDMTVPEAGSYRLEAALCYENQIWDFEVPFIVD